MVERGFVEGAALGKEAIERENERERERERGKSY